jgi:hypothetical protein
MATRSFTAALDLDASEFVIAGGDGGQPLLGQ